MTVQEALELAGHLQQAGRSAEAEHLLQQVLAVDPHQPDALHSLGLLCFTSGRVPEAIELVERAITNRPMDAAFHANLGVILLHANRQTDAIAALRRAVDIQPNLANAHYNLANVLRDSGQSDEAMTAYRRAIDADPVHFEALSNLGQMLLNDGQAKEAIEFYRRALALRPQLAEAHRDLGVALQSAGRLDESIQCFQAALALNADYADAENDLAFALLQQGKLEESMAHCRKALALRADFAAAKSTLGVSLWLLGERDLAVDLFRQALQIDPDFIRARTNLAGIQQDLGQLDEAEENYRQVIAHQPGSADAQYGLGFVLLLRGQFREGWEKHEWRIYRQQAGEESPLYGGRRWNGEPLNGQPILLFAEQGLGDAIQFIRYAPMVVQRGGRVMVACIPSLHRLLRTAPDVEKVESSTEEFPPTQWYCPLMSLPHVLGTTLETVPAKVPYLWADPCQVEVFAKKFGNDRRLKIGIVWAGNPKHLDDRNRSMSLSHLLPLLRLPDVCVVSLQKGPPVAQVKNLPADVQLIDWTDELNDLADTAALITNLDLVIGVDTSVIHLAGALGKPVWLLLPKSPDFRWMLDREDSPWYPTMRIFRQKIRGDWDEVVGRVIDQIQGGKPNLSRQV
jgi:tetratricopeptide (TPR) repeat protein